MPCTITERIKKDKGNLYGTERGITHDNIKSTRKRVLLYGGEGEIRTHGGGNPTPVFKTGALNHSTTSPGLIRLFDRYLRSDTDQVYFYKKK